MNTHEIVRDLPQPFQRSVLREYPFPETSLESSCVIEVSFPTAEFGSAAKEPFANGSEQCEQLSKGGETECGHTVSTRPALLSGV
jgi:hypothetical protein